MSVITFGAQKAFLENPGLQKSPLTATVAGVVILVLLSGALECTRTQWDKLKILRMFGGDVLLWNVSKPSLEGSLPKSTWMGDNRGVTVTTQNGQMIVYGLIWQIITVLGAK